MAEDEEGAERTTTTESKANSKTGVKKKTRIQGTQG